MNGTKPEFLKDVTVDEKYYKTPNPYENAPSCNVNLLELSRYAKKVGKQLSELTRAEVLQFAM